MNRTMNGLLTSRKFWLALIVAISASVLYIQGAITAEKLADALVALAGVLMTTIAAEDMAKQFGAERRLEERINEFARKRERL